MTEKIERINILIEKKSKIKVDDCNQACKEINELYNENNDAKVLVNFLFQGGTRVASQFITDYYGQMPQEKQSEIANLIIKELGIKDDKSSKCGPGFAIVTALYKLDIKENLLNILSKVIELAESGTGFTSNLCIAFKNHLLNSIGKGVLALDYSDWSKVQNQRLLRFIKATEQDISKTSFAEELDTWIGKYIGEPIVTPMKNEEVSQEKVVEILGDPSQDRPIIEVNLENKINLEKEISQADELMKKLLSVTAETEKLFNTIFAKNITMDKLQAKISLQTSEISALRTEIENKKAERLALENRIQQEEIQNAILKESLLNKDLAIEALDGRLKESFQSDDISNNQELMTLKKNIASTIKLQYEDYIHNKDAECNEDNYEALKINLNNVFRALDRFGIEM